MKEILEDIVQILETGKLTYESKIDEIEELLLTKRVMHFNYCLTPEFQNETIS